jgi:hypothetical protein
MTRHCIAGVLMIGVALGSGAHAAPARKAARKPVRKPAAKAPGLPAELKAAVSLDILPASAALDGPRAAQRLIVMAATKDGATIDVTDRVAFTVANPKLLKIAGGKALPLADGETRITAKLGTLTSPAAGITITNSKAPVATEFVNDVMPVLSKAGCNATSCHGSPAGKGGFKLSLFGYEPDLDHPAIVKDADGKRVNLKDPAKSLLIQKATGTVSHAGGTRFKVGSPEYNTLLSWVKEGAAGLGEFEARVKEVQVLPDQPWMPAPNSRQRLAVTALMSDGTTRDVTDKALFSSNDDAIAAVDEAGNVTASRAGETSVMVRFMGQVAISRVAVLPSWKLDRWPAIPQNNYIDGLVQAKLRKLRTVPSDLCTDEEFIRRVSLDVRGIIPEPEEVQKFVADRSTLKRAKLIDEYLESEEFVDLWTVKWNDTLRNNPRVTRLGAGDYARWIREQVQKNRPYDEWVRELLTAEGKNTNIKLDLENLPRQLQNRQAQIARLNEQPGSPAANYFVVSRDPLDATAATSQVFLGVRIECARCHNHPFEKWTQTDFYGLAAFFNGIQVRQAGGQGPALVLRNPRNPLLRHPKTNEFVEPRTLDGVEVKVGRFEDRRESVAAWITSPQNPFFAKNLVNRVWGPYLGRGIVDPVDDLRVTNPASNPELLDALAKDFADHKFDIKHVHRTILNSRTYQQSSKPNQWNRQDGNNFARFYPKRLMAEQLYDSISQATGIFLNTGVRRRPARRPLAGGAQAQALRNALPDEPVERVMQLAAIPGGAQRGRLPATQFLDTFGKPRREVVCECERSAEGNMNQALALINGDEVNRKLSAPLGRTQQLVRSAKPEPAVVEELYLATLSRRPRPAEMDEAVALIRSGKSRAEGIEDLMWSLLNSREFLFNH